MVGKTTMTTRICPKCRHLRQPNETAPDWQCPACGVAYAKADSAGRPAAAPRTHPRAARTSSSSVPWGKLLVLIVALVGGSWWYFQGGRVLSEESVTQFYQQHTIATLSRKPEALCSQLATDFQSSVVMFAGGGRTLQEANKEQTCEALSAMFDNFEMLGEKMGGILQLDYDHRIKEITLSKDKKMATVETTFTFDVAGSIMNMQGSSVDTLVRRNGRVMVLQSEGKTQVSSLGK